MSLLSNSATDDEVKCFVVPGACTVGYPTVPKNNFWNGLDYTVYIIYKSGVPHIFCYCF